VCNGLIACWQKRVLAFDIVGKSGVGENGALELSVVLYACTDDFFRCYAGFYPVYQGGEDIIAAVFGEGSIDSFQH
jgi:hypothetical protein